MAKLKSYQDVINKRYKGYEKCFLPLDSWDEKRDVFEWVHYDGENFRVNSELYEAMSDIAYTGLTFHYEVTVHDYDGDKNVMTTEVLISHGHNFNEVISEVYSYPESFRIPDKYKDEYSKQELEYLDRVQKYLLLVGLKDKRVSKEKVALYKKYDKASKDGDKSLLKKYDKEENELILKEALARCDNKLAKKYSNYLYIDVDNDDVLKAILSGKRKYRIYRQYSFSESRVGYKFFILDKDGNYRCAIEIVKEEIIPFKDLKKSMVDFKTLGFDNFEDYKKNLLEKFKDEDDFEEEFSDDVNISYATFKILEKFN